MAMTAQDYKFYKSLNPSELTDQDRKDLIDFERAEAKAPSLDDVQWATDIDKMASKNPSTVGRELKESGDYDKAQQILNADRAYAATLGPRKMDAYVRKVQRIPDDLIEGNDFKFNWKSAYENLKNEKLRDTEADYDKLQKFIQSNMYDVTDPVNLQKIAYDFHMFNPNTMSWADFINSEQGKEFRNYIKDVEKYQREKRINEIFDNESNFTVDFMLPVAKENARSALLKGEEPNVGPAITFDAATNLAMMAPGKIGLIAPPVITNVGQYALNDEEPEVAGINTLLGVGSNAATPFVIKRGGRYFQKPGAGYSQRVEVQGTADAIANKVDKINKRFEEGALQGIDDYARTPTGEIKLDKNGLESIENIGFVNAKKKIIFTDDPERAFKRMKVNPEGYTIRPKKEAGMYDKGIIPEKDVAFLKSNEMILRQNPLQHINLRNYRNIRKDLNKGLADVKKAEELRNKAYKDIQNPDMKDVSGLKGKAAEHFTSINLAKKHQSEKVINQALDKLLKGGKISEMELKELYGLGYNPKESLTSFLSRLPPDILKNYLTNFMGRKVSGGVAMNLPQMLFGTDLQKKVDEYKNKKPKISEIFGGE